MFELAESVGGTPTPALAAAEANLWFFLGAILLLAGYVVLLATLWRADAELREARRENQRLRERVSDLEEGERRTGTMLAERLREVDRALEALMRIQSRVLPRLVLNNGDGTVIIW